MPGSLSLPVRRTQEGRPPRSSAQRRISSWLVVVLAAAMAIHSYPIRLVRVTDTIAAMIPESRPSFAVIGLPTCVANKESRKKAEPDPCLDRLLPSLGRKTLLSLSRARAPDLNVTIV